MSAEIRGILKSVGIELLGSSLDKVTRIHFRPHGPDLDDTGTPSPTATGPELTTQLSYSQNPTRIFLSAADLQALWDNDGVFNWDSWYKLALYYNDAQSIERVYVPDGFVSVFDDTNWGAPDLIGSINITDMNGDPGPTGPDGVTSSIIDGQWLELWGNQWITLTPTNANGFGSQPQIKLATRGDPDTVIMSGVMYTELPDGSLLIYIPTLLSAMGEVAGGPWNPEGQYTFIIVGQNGTGSTTTNPTIGIGPIHGVGTNANLSPVIREIGVVGQPGITSWTIQAWSTDVGFLEGINLETATRIDFFDPATVPPLDIQDAAFTVETPLDGYPSRLQVDFAAVYAADPTAWDTYWAAAGAVFYIRVTNPSGVYDTYAVIQTTPGGGG